VWRGNSDFRQGSPRAAANVGEVNFIAITLAIEKASDVYSVQMLRQTWLMHSVLQYSVNFCNDGYL